MTPLPVRGTEALNDQHSDRSDETPRPLVAPCRALSPREPLQWLTLGWRDLRAAPFQSLLFGALVVLASAGLSAAAWLSGGFWVLVGLLTAFVFAGPVLAIGFYTVSQTLEEGRRPSMGESWRRLRRSAPGSALFANLLLVVALLWARAATMVHVFFPRSSDASLLDFAVYLGVGTAVGAFFCVVIFVVSAFSLPMLHDRDVDAVTAALSSINAVLRNKAAASVWAGVIVAGVALGFATALLGLMVVLPVIAYATWHGYRRAVDSALWPYRMPPQP